MLNLVMVKYDNIISFCIQALLVVVSWTVETCCCSKKADTKDIEKVCESFSNKSYGINDTKDMSG